MGDRGESLRRRRTYPLGGRVRGDEFGMRLLQLPEPAHQLVVFGVGYLGVVEDVIAPVVVFDLLPEPSDLLCNVLHGSR